MTPCNDLRIGGTLSGSGLTGGISVSDTRIFVSDWSGLLGKVGFDRQLVSVAGRGGGYPVGDGTPDVRFVTLNVAVTRWGQTGRGSLTEGSEAEQVDANTDAFFAILGDTDGFFLERVLADGTSRFVHAYAIDPFPLTHDRKWRRASIPLRADTPFWRAGGTQTSDSLVGSDTLTNAGNARLHDSVLVFPSSGATIVSTALGWSIATAATSGAVTVDLGARTVKRAGTDVDALLTLADGVWPVFEPGVNAVTVTGSAVTATWREPWQS